MVYEDELATTYRDELNTIVKETNIRFLNELLTINKVKAEKERRARKEISDAKQRSIRERDKIKRLKKDHDLLSKSINLLFRKNKALEEENVLFIYIYIIYDKIENERENAKSNS